MGRPRRIPAKESVIAAASLCVVAALPGCSARRGPVGGRSSRAHHGSLHGSRPRPGRVRVHRGGGPAGAAQREPGHARANAERHVRQRHVRLRQGPGRQAGPGVRASRLPRVGRPPGALPHRPGTGVNYRAGSPIAKKARASEAFRALNADVQNAILGQLKAGRTRVRLSAAQLPAVAFESTSSDLYWGFRGTQGLTVTGRGTRENGRYAGTLSYVIRDSYGFPVGDTLDGFGPPMRYLQTVCGAPRHAGGAHWFPDTITVTVPFNRPA